MEDETTTPKSRVPSPRRPTPPAGTRAAILGILAECLSASTADVVLGAAIRRVGSTDEALERRGVDRGLLTQLERGLTLFCRDPQRLAAAQAALRALAARGEDSEPPAPAVVAIEDEDSVVNARSRARCLCDSLGFNTTDQLKVATAVSELARNIQRYVGRGTITLTALGGSRPGIDVLARDDGPGIPDLKAVLSGRYVSKTGLGLGLRGCQRLMDEFDVQSEPNRGTTISARKFR